jgi:tetratricopeptide (TPR) repeat protein
MRFFSLLIIFSLIVVPLSFSQSQEFITSLYSDYLKGLFYIEKGEYKLGLESLERAKAKDPKSVHIRLKIATVLMRLDKPDEAEKVLKEAKKLDPNDLDISLVLIFLYAYTQNDAELEREYEAFLQKAHELKPKSTDISEYLAQFYFYKKKPQEAIKIYEAILQTNPNYVDALFWLGYLYDQTGKRKEAIDIWKKGLKISPEYAPILNSLGYYYAQEGVNLSEAETMVKKALEKEPENGAYLDSLGWIYFKKGDLKKAEESLTKAIALIKDPEIYEHLGDLYIKLDNKDKAILYYQEGLTNFPDYTSLQKKVKQYGEEVPLPKN